MGTRLHPIFVYGTFRAGESNRRVIEPFVVSSRPARLHAAELYYVDPYPMAVDGDGTVIGELIELPRDAHAAALAALDRFEGYDAALDVGAYRRHLRDVEDAQSGATVQAWVYLGDRLAVSQSPHVESGDWRRRGNIQGGDE